MKAVAVEPMEQMLITDAKGGEKIGDQGPHKIQVSTTISLIIYSLLCPHHSLTSI